MRDGFFLLLFSRPRPCQRHDPALIPPPSAGTHAVAWRMHALVAQGTEHRIPDPGVARSNRVRGASGPSPSGRASRPQREGRGFEPRRLHDMRHAAACKRRHSEERRHVKTARPRDGIRRQRPPAGRARDGGRPARPRAGPCGCGAAAARLLPKQETAGSNPVIRSIRKTKTMDLIQQWDSQPSFPWDASGENMDEQPRHGHASSRTGTCHRPGSSEEEQVPFKHWVRIS